MSRPLRSNNVVSRGFLIREVAIGRRARYTSAGTHFAQRRRVDSADVEQRPGGIEQRPPGRRDGLRSPRLAIRRSISETRNRVDIVNSTDSFR